MRLFSTTRPSRPQVKNVIMTFKMSAKMVAAYLRSSNEIMIDARCLHLRSPLSLGLQQRRPQLQYWRYWVSSVRTCCQSLSSAPKGKVLFFLLLCHTPLNLVIEQVQQGSITTFDIESRNRKTRMNPSQTKSKA